MSRLSDIVADHVWRWMDVCRQRGVICIEGELRENGERIEVTARCLLPRPAEHITLTFKLPEE